MKKIAIIVISALVALVTAVPVNAQVDGKGDFLPTVVIPKGMRAVGDQLVPDVYTFVGQLLRKCPSGDCDYTGVVALARNDEVAKSIISRPSGTYAVMQGVKLLQYDINGILEEYKKKVDGKIRTQIGDLIIAKKRIPKETSEAKRARKAKIVRLQLELRDMKKNRDHWIKTLQYDLEVLAEKECFIILNVGFLSEGEYQELYGNGAQNQLQGRPQPPQVQGSGVTYTFNRRGRW